MLKLEPIDPNQQSVPSQPQSLHFVPSLYMKLTPKRFIGFGEIAGRQIQLLAVQFKPYTLQFGV